MVCFSFVNKEFHAIEFHQQIIGELDVRLIHLVDQQYHLLIGVKRVPELAALDVVGNIVNLAITN